MDLPLVAPDACSVSGRLQPLLLNPGTKAQCRTIGKSRGGRPLFGVRLGHGPLRISITAGAHSDEPAGPLAALELIDFLTGTDEGRALLQRTTWSIFPHVNPDGAALNAAWFAEPLDPVKYLRNVFREAPGDDVEFNYPGGEAGSPAPRPENAAVAAFLREGGPYHLHASLHGMGFAEGAWWLIGRSWVDRSAPLRQRLREIFERHRAGFHDIDRHGEKGFTRIERGFSTTPTSTAMQEFFRRENDPVTARLFLPSSMEYVASLGGDPLVMVSELPLFRLHGGGELADPPQEPTPYQRFRTALKAAQGALLKGDPGPVTALLAEYDVRPLPLRTQITAIREAVLASVDFLLPS